MFSFFDSIYMIMKIESIFLNYSFEKPLKLIICMNTIELHRLKAWF